MDVANLLEKEDFEEALWFWKKLFISVAVALPKSKFEQIQQSKIITRRSPPKTHLHLKLQKGSPADFTTKDFLCSCPNPNPGFCFRHCSK